MKKYFIFLIAILIFIFSSSAFASCNLDTTRWKWVGSNSEVGLFYDTTTLRILNNKLIEVWVCYYYPNHCKKHFYEHYHYCLTRIDYSVFLHGLKHMIVIDSNGNSIGNPIFGSDIVFMPMPPGSAIEILALRIKYDYGL